MFRIVFFNMNVILSSFSLIPCFKMDYAIVYLFFIVLFEGNS